MGAFAGSPGPYGTYDMEGDVWQWNETALDQLRNIRGGSWFDFTPGDEQNASLTSSLAEWSNENPAYDYYGTGFRVTASVPEPSTIALLCRLPVGLRLATAGLTVGTRRHEAGLVRPRSIARCTPPASGGHVGRNWQPARQVGLAPLPMAA